MRTVFMRTRCGHARLPFPIVAVVTHVFRVMSHVLVITYKKLAHLFRILLDFDEAFLAVFQINGLQLECADGVRIESFLFRVSRLFASSF